jgi:hypothetical protein
LQLGYFSGLLFQFPLKLFQHLVIRHEFLLMQLVLRGKLVNLFAVFAKRCFGGDDLFFEVRVLSFDKRLPLY